MRIAQIHNIFPRTFAKPKFTVSKLNEGNYDKVLYNTRQKLNFWAGSWKEHVTSVLGMAN